MLRQLISKWGIMSIEMQKAIEGDMSMVNEDGSFDYVDNQPDEPQGNLVDANVTITEDNADDDTGLSDAEKAEIMAAEAAEANAEDDFFN